MSSETESPDQSPDGAAVPSQNALNFIKEIADDDFKYLLFTDHLITTSDTGRELGEFTINMTKTTYKGNECFMVHANSHGAIDNVPCGTSIMAHVSKRLETLEQHHHEYVKLENCPLDRRTVTVRQENGDYVINRAITQGEDTQKSMKTYTADSMQGFISEGSSLLLHRLLVQKASIPEDFQLVSFDSEANLSTTTFRRLEERTQNVENIELKVYGIERTINSVKDLPTTWQSYFTSDGFLANRVQVGSPVTMKLAKLPKAVIRDEDPVKPTFEKQPLNWQEDMQLYSKFLDRKDELKTDHMTYISHHPELKALLADFLQFLLLRKPDDVIDFASNYFASFSSKVPSEPSYSSSSSPTKQS